VLLVLEDLHHGDLPSVQFVDAALRHCANAPLMVVALARPEAKDLFPELWRSRAMTEIHLGPLGKRAAEKLVRSILGDDFPGDAASAIVERADGNALFLEELIRFAATSGGAIDVVPETLRAMVQARLEALDPDLRRALRAASVFGRRFWRGAVFSLIGDEGRTPKSMDLARGWIDQLVQQEIVTRRGEGRFPGEEEWMFRHALVRDAAYAMLTDSDRTLGHRLAAEWLERAGETDAMVLAEHYERGGDKTRALERYLRAADHALEANDFENAIDRAERGVTCGAQGTSLGTLRWIQAQCFLFRGENERGDVAAREAIRLLPQGSLGWCGAIGEAVVANGRLGKIDAVVDLADLARRAPIDADARVTWGTSLTRASIELINSGRSALADAVLLVVAPLADEPSVAARIAHARASKALFEGDTGIALRALQTSASAFEDIGDLRHACLELGNVGFALLELGDAKGAQDALRESLSGAERMGLLNVIAGVKANLALALARLGDPESLVVGRDATERAKAQGNRRTEAAARVYYAMALARTDLNAAEQEARKAVAAAEPIPPVQAYAQGLLAELLLGRGEVAEARFTIEAAMRTLVSLGGLEAGEALVRRVHAEVLDATGNQEQSRKEIVAACERLMKRADKIGDEAMRASFLKAVPDNAATIDLALRWKVARMKPGP
jgi:tetratricopeptide (TPR) repeat protein